jgi:pSer/pThr/pTyr-binding forkhead associated (FHA) protein
MGKFLVEDRGGFRQVSVDKLMTMGRSENNDLVLNARFASRRHAWVWLQGDQVIIEDLSSMHGTFVNGLRITTPRFLNYNDVISIGEATLTYVTDREPSKEQTPPRGVPRLMASQIFCAHCGAPNYPQARYCGNCGHTLTLEVDFRQNWPGEHSQTGQPITPMEPVMARPFSTIPSQPQTGTDSKIWVLILLLAILAVILVTIVGVLLVYTLG